MDRILQPADGQCKRRCSYPRLRIRHGSTYAREIAPSTRRELSSGWAPDASQPYLKSHRYDLSLCLMLRPAEAGAVSLVGTSRLGRLDK
jgi:hypothetical protein